MFLLGTGTCTHVTMTAFSDTLKAMALTIVAWKLLWLCSTGTLPLPAVAQAIGLRVLCVHSKCAFVRAMQTPDLQSHCGTPSHLHKTPPCTCATAGLIAKPAGLTAPANNTGCVPTVSRPSMLTQCPCLNCLTIPAPTACGCMPTVSRRSLASVPLPERHPSPLPAMQAPAAQHHHISVTRLHIVGDGCTHTTRPTCCCEGCGAHMASFYLYTHQ